MSALVVWWPYSKPKIAVSNMRTSVKISPPSQPASQTNQPRESNERMTFTPFVFGSLRASVC